MAGTDHGDRIVPGVPMGHGGRIGRIVPTDRTGRIARIDLAARNGPMGRDRAIPTAAKHFVSKRPLKGPYPEGLETALFGLGCFWGAERLFWQVEGVWVTAVGYAGGITPNPTYQETCTGLTGHAEVVLVVYDPKIVSYAELLKLFWESHDPTQGMRQGNDVGTTYRSAIYAFSDAQR